MKIRSGSVVCLLAALTAGVFAQTTATTDPVGFSTVTLRGNSDSYIYIPFKRAPEYSGLAASIAGNILTLAGTPGFTDNQFVYVAGTQPKHYFVFLKTGTKAGMYYTIQSNTAGTLTIDTAGDDLSAAITGTTSLEIIPYDTLGTIFPNGQGVNPSPTHSLASRQSEVWIPDSSSAGTNLAFTTSYYYYSGTSGAGPGWRKAGASATIVNDDTLPPDNLFMVRHNVATGTTLTFSGNVQVATLSTPVGTIAANVDQDNAVALPFATQMTLGQLNLGGTSAFAGSPSHSLAQRGDQILVWDNTITGKNKAADAIYYYYTGANSPGPGWRKAGAAATLATNDVVIGPDKGMVIRKKATNPATTLVWSVTPPYVTP